MTEYCECESTDDEVIAAIEAMNAEEPKFSEAHMWRRYELFWVLAGYPGKSYTYRGFRY